MRKITWLLAVVICLSAFLAGCGGSKSADDVVKELDGKLKEMDGYKAVGAMKLLVGEAPQEYAVEVWYKQPEFYRIELTNKKKDVTQIVLRNDEGVFVLTPHLKKSFRFQSDWPKNQGQVYLYQTLVQGIISDTQRKFTVDKDRDAYVFDVAGNYQNLSFARQKIWLGKSDYAPRHIEISDTSGQMIVEVDFSHFEFGGKFDKQDFDMKRNLTAYSTVSVATGAQVGEEEGEKQPSAESQSFGVIEPAYVPEEVARIGNVTDVKVGDTTGVLLRYGGKYNFVLVESKPQAQTVSSLNGDIVDLGFTYGVLTGNEQKTLHWTLDGVEYRLSSGDLPLEEMTAIATSVEDQVGK